MHLASLVVMTLLLPAARADDSASRAYVGLIASISGTCVLKTGSVERTLDAKRDQYHKLYEGDHLHCGQNSSLILELSGEPPKSGPRDKPRSSANAGPEKTGGRATVEPGEDMEVRAVDLPRGDGMDPAVRELDRAGARRASPSIVYSPAQGETVNPDSLTIQWIPSEEGTRLSLYIQGPDGTEIWKDYGIDGKAGQLEPAEARARLRDYRHNTGLGPLTLYVADTAAHRSQSTFYLLSEEQQKTLDQQLAFCEKGGTAILVRLCRISAFEDLGMLNSVASEYRRSLELAPESEELLNDALSVCLSIGDQPCAREMKARLSRH